MEISDRNGRVIQRLRQTDLLQQGVTFHSQLLSALCVIPLLCILISSHTGSSLSLPTAISTEPNYLTDGGFSNHLKISFSQPSDSWDWESLLMQMTEALWTLFCV